MNARDIGALRARWFTTRTPNAITPGDRAALQAAHDTERHRQTDPANGSCFCCCTACDPTEHTP